MPLDLWRHVDEEIDRRVQELITKGELAREEGVRLREKLLSPMVSGPGAMSDEAKLEQLLSEHGVPTREELDRLYAQLEALSSKLDGMLNQGRAEEPQS